MLPGFIHLKGPEKSNQNRELQFMPFTNVSSLGAPALCMNRGRVS